MTAAIDRARGRGLGHGALDLGAVLTPSGPAVRGSVEAQLSPSWSAVAGGELAGWQDWAAWVGVRARW